MTLAPGLSHEPSPSSEGPPFDESKAPRGAKRVHSRHDDSPAIGGYTTEAGNAMHRRVRARLLHQPQFADVAVEAPLCAAKVAAAAAFAEREFFVADIDVPYLSHSEFASVLQHDMALLLGADPALGGGPTVNRRTKRQWAMIRRRMCDVFPAGCARPRRLSNDFLESERCELETYRKDARAFLRNEPLDDARDARSGAHLGKLWWQRYPFDLPKIPPRGASVFIRLRPGDSGSAQTATSLHDADQSRGDNATPNREMFSTEENESRFMNQNNEELEKLRHSSPLLNRKSVVRKRKPPRNFEPTTTGKLGISQRFVEGKFLGIASNDQITVRIGSNVLNVPDLSVMSVPLDQFAANPDNSVSCETHSVQSSYLSVLNGLRDPKHEHETLPPFTGNFTSQDRGRRLAEWSPLSFPSGHLQSNKRLFSTLASNVSPHMPPQIPQSLTPSPRKAFSLKSRTGTNVEYEVHVRALAESVRLLDRKDALLSELHTQNNLAEVARAESSPISVEIRRKHAAVMEALAHVNARLDVVLPGLRSGTGSDTAMGSDFVSLHSSLPRTPRNRHVVSREVGHLLDFGPSPPPREQQSRLGEGQGCHQHDSSHLRGTPASSFTPASQKLGGLPLKLREYLPTGPSPRLHFPRNRMHLSDTQSGILTAQQSMYNVSVMDRIGSIAGDHGGAISSGSRNDAFEEYSSRLPVNTTIFGAPTAREAKLSHLRQAHSAKDVDFRTAAGAAMLSKALARQALGKLPENCNLKLAPATLRADVIECVSTCVALLIRARSTRDIDAIHEILDVLRVKCQENETLLDIVKGAVRDFDTTSSESQ